MWGLGCERPALQWKPSELRCTSAELAEPFAEPLETSCFHQKRVLPNDNMIEYYSLCMFQYMLPCSSTFILFIYWHLLTWVDKVKNHSCFNVVKYVLMSSQRWTHVLQYFWVVSDGNFVNSNRTAVSWPGLHGTSAAAQSCHGIGLAIGWTLDTWLLHRQEVLPSVIWNMSCDVLWFLWIFMDLMAHSTTSNSSLLPCSAGSLTVVGRGEVCALCVRKISATSIYFESLPYRVHPETGLIDFDELRCSVTKKYRGPIPVPIALPRIRGSQEKYVGLARMYYIVICW